MSDQSRPDSDPTVPAGSDRPAGDGPAPQPAPAEQPYFVPTEHQAAWSSAHYFGTPQPAGTPDAPGPDVYRPSPYGTTVYAPVGQYGQYGQPPAGPYGYAPGYPGGYPQAGYGGYGQPPYGGGYPLAGAASDPYFWTPPPAPPRRNRHRRIVVGTIAAVAVTALTVGGVAYGIDRSRSNANQNTALTTPNAQTNPFDNGNANGGTGQLPLPSDGTGSGSSGATGTTGTATAAQSVGVVDINTTLDYGTGKAAGTGIVLTADGEILTNNHVIDGSTAISVTVVSTGKTYTATVVGTDPTDDVAVIQLKDASGLATAKLGDSSTVKVGDAVTAVGNAGGTGGTPSSATGTVTALNQSLTASDSNGSNAERLTGMIQINADIQAGDSGGPLYDKNGAVIGIDTAASSGSARFNTATTGFAIPLAKALPIASKIVAGQASSTIHIGYPAFLGVSLSSQADTATIAGVVDGSAAAKAGLVAGDTVTSVGGTSVATASALSTAMATHKPGDQVKISWTDASGQSHSATVTLGAGPAD